MIRPTYVVTCLTQLWRYLKGTYDLSMTSFQWSPSLTASPQNPTLTGSSQLAWGAGHGILSASHSTGQPLDICESDSHCCAPNGTLLATQNLPGALGMGSHGQVTEPHCLLRSKHRHGALVAGRSSMRAGSPEAHALAMGVLAL